MRTPRFLGKLAIAAASILSVSATAPAYASVWLLTFTGTADSSSIDLAGLFGSPGQSLTGQAFEFKIAYNDSRSSRYDSTGASYHIVSGYENTPATISFNGIDVSIKNSIRNFDQDILALENDSGFGDLIQLTYANGFGYNTYSIFANGADVFSGSPFLYDGLTLSGASILGSFTIKDTINAPVLQPSLAPPMAFGSLRTTRLTVQLLSGDGIWRVRPQGGGGGVPGVPEPASWAMMIAGFGFVGGALRSGKVRRSRLRRAV